MPVAELAPRQVPVVALLPQPPEVLSEGCTQVPTIGWSSADLGNTQSFDSPCVAERLDANGCVGERVISRFNDEGQVVRSQRWIFDPSVLQPMYGVPTEAITTFEYDAQGNMVRRETDVQSDGSIDDTQTLAYDAQGRITVEVRTTSEREFRLERDYDDADHVISETTFDGETRRTVLRNYRADGSLIFEHTSSNGVLVYARDNTFDPEGRPLSELRAWPASNKTEITEYRYDSLGLRVRTWTRAFSGRSGVVERHTFRRWPDGTIRSELYEQVVNDSRISRRSLREYDSAGREISSVNDHDVDGVYESGRRYSYDPQGKRLTEVTFNGDQVLRDVRRVFDSQGREIEYADHVRRLIVRTAYHDLSVHRSSFDFEGVMLSMNSSTYDDEGHVLLIESDADGDGVIDQRFENTWTAGGNRLRSRGDRDGDGDGVWDYESAHMYDRAEQLLYTMQDSDRDGGPEEAELRSYACLIAD